MNTAGLERLIRDFAINQLMLKADTFVYRAQANASYRTGRLVESISHDEVIDSGDVVRCTATCTADYARYVEEGTGIFGPEGTPIRARHTRRTRTGKTLPGLLKFDSPIFGLVYTVEVQGSEPTRFWQRTRDEWPDIVASG